MGTIVKVFMFVGFISFVLLLDLLLSRCRNKDQNSFSFTLLCVMFFVVIVVVVDSFIFFPCFTSYVLHAIDVRELFLVRIK